MADPMSSLLPNPPYDRSGVVAWVTEHLGHLCCDVPYASPAFAGGQQAADGALASLDVTGYARSRSMVDPPERRGASKLSPYIRHGLLTLSEVWRATADAPSRDRFRYHSELLWQDYARHWYANHGRDTARPIAYEPARASTEWPAEPWPADMNCVARTLAELRSDGWCVNQTRMWLASQYSFRAGGDTFAGEQLMFRHLLDGSRAANRLGWQWVAGTTRSRVYGFARQQVRKRASRYCDECVLNESCPISGYAPTESRSSVARPALRPFSEAYGSPDVVPASSEPSAVWLTAESLGTRDPALAAHRDLPAIFVFDEPLLNRLRLSGKRLVFLTETLAELSRRRSLEIHLGRPTDVLASQVAAVTAAPVPGFSRLSRQLDLERHPWPWLRPPTTALHDYLEQKGRVPSFREFCDLTRPQTQDGSGAG